MALFSKKQSQTVPKRRQAESFKERASEESLDDRYTFRRNRTLTGSISSNVASANEAKAQLKSPRVHAHDLARKRRHIGGVLIAVMLSAAALFWLITQFTAGAVVKAQEMSLKLDPIYEQTIQEYLSRHPAERLRFLMNTTGLDAYLQSVAPEIASIKTNGSAGFGKTAFIVTLRQPIAGWNVGGKRQYVDATGTSFERNYFAEPSLQIVDNSGVKVASGQAVASNRFLGFFGRVVGLSKTYGYAATQIIIPKDATRQVELQLDGVGYPVKFSIDRTAGEQVEDMDRGVKWLKARSVTPKYLDVRVSGKAFYR